MTLPTLSKLDRSDSREVSFGGRALVYVSRVFLRSRGFAGRIFGTVCLVGGVLELANGNHRQAIIGFALGIGIIVVTEWARWRSKG